MTNVSKHEQDLRKIVDDFTRESPSFHTAIGSLFWSADHVRRTSRQREPGVVWGGVFCLSAARFLAECDPYLPEISELSLLGNAFRLDCLLRRGCWETISFRADGSWKERVGHAVLGGTLSGRYPFMYANNKAQLDAMLEREAKIVLHENRKTQEQFWSFWLQSPTAGETS